MHLVVQDTFFGVSSIPGRSLLIDKFNVTIQHSQTLLGMLLHAMLCSRTNPPRQVNRCVHSNC